MSSPTPSADPSAPLSEGVPTLDEIGEIAADAGFDWPETPPPPFPSGVTPPPPFPEGVTPPPPFPTGAEPPLDSGDVVASPDGGFQIGQPWALPPRRKPRRGWPVMLVILTLLGAGGVAAYYHAPPLVEWRHQRQLARQVGALTATATDHLHAGRYDDAERSARQALDLLPTHEPAQQIIAAVAQHRDMVRQREEQAAAALAAAEKLVEDDNFPAALDAFGAICRNPETPAASAKQADQRRTELHAATASLSLPKDWPTDAMLRLDGQVQPPGATMITGISLGRHTFRATRPGHRPPAEVTLEFRGIRPVSLPPITWKLLGGKVAITSEPSGAAVWCDGKTTGRNTPCTFDDVDVGKVSYLLKLPGRIETAVEGVVASTATLALTATLLPLPLLPVAGTQAGERREFNLTPTLKVAFRWCPAGSFTMGGTDSVAAPTEKPARTVRLSQGFWVGETEFTQGQWQRLAATSAAAAEVRPAGPGPDYPMNFVSWDQLCGNNARTGGVLGEITAFLRKHGGDGWFADLPTEAQWEYACRAGTTAAYGSPQPGVAALYGSGWFQANSGRVIHPVGQKEANPWGFKDLHGNVLEWCRDWAQDSYNKMPAADPVGPRSGWAIVVRGGSCQSSADTCRSAARSQAGQTTASAVVGFRLVLRRADTPPSGASPQPPAKPGTPQKAPPKPAPAKKAPPKKAPAKAKK